jgi:hypothetical protein
LLKWYFSNKTHFNKKQGKWVFLSTKPICLKSIRIKKIAELQSSSFKPQIFVHMHLRGLEFWSHSPLVLLPMSVFVHDGNVLGL